MSVVDKKMVDGVELGIKIQYCVSQENVDEIR